MYKVIDYFEPIDSSSKKAILRGQFWWTCFQFFFDRPKVTRFYCNRPTEILDITKFNPEREVIDNDNKTENNEFLAVCKYKLRPIIVISTSGNHYHDRTWEGGEYFLVAPIYSLRDDITDEYRCSPKFVWDVITYQYNSLFYLPKSSSYQIHEGIIHFDRIITLHKSWLIKQRSACLTGDAMNCLDNWLKLFIYGKIGKKFSEDLQAYQNIVGQDPKIRQDLFGTAKYLNN